MPQGPPLFPPGHLVDDLVSVTAAFAALCALYQREQVGAGQFVELSANEAVALMADWALPNVSARVLAGEPPAEVRSGSGPGLPRVQVQGRLRAAGGAEPTAVARAPRVAG